MFFVVFFKQKTAYEMRISDWSSDVCSSDLAEALHVFQDLAHLVGVGGDVARLVHQHRAERAEEGADGVDRIAGRAEPDADRMAQIGRASCRDRVGPYV